MTNLNKTKDYSIFKKHENNRAIDPFNLKKIVASLKIQNLLEFRPILIDANYRIIDGQHRLEAAKQLELEVYYQVNQESTHEDIVLLNSNQKKWLQEDYVNYYISRGNLEYKKLKDYAIQKGLPIAEVLSMTKWKSTEQSSEVRVGTYKFPDADYLSTMNITLDKLSDIIRILDKYILSNKKFISGRKFKRALLAFLKNPEVDFQTFLSKITLKVDVVKACADTYAYYNMFKDIYNWKNQNPLS